MTELADECKRLLDAGWEIRLFANQIGSYTAQGRCRETGAREITDDFTPSKALYRLTLKIADGEIWDGKLPTKGEV